MLGKDRLNLLGEINFVLSQTGGSTNVNTTAVATNFVLNMTVNLIDRNARRDASNAQPEGTRPQND